MSITFIRRRGLGHGSTMGMKNYLEGLGVPVNVWRADRRAPTEPGLIVRWGCTASLPFTGSVINTAGAIHRVNDKAGYRVLVQGENESLVPPTITHIDQDATYPLVVRPRRHAQGRNLAVVQNKDELRSVLCDPVFMGWYASSLIEKEAEYRVYVGNGRVVSVARKTPANPEAVAWNVSQGGRFDVVHWGDWPIEVCRLAIEAFKPSGLDFGGVDVMVERGTGRPYLLEINSAPSLPSLSDGTVSYRQVCMAKYFHYLLSESNAWIELGEGNNWRDLIHPSIQ